MAIKIKVTNTFTVSASTGETFKVQEITRYETVKVAGVNTERLGKNFLKTEEGRGVMKNDDGTYSIPSLGLKTHRMAEEPKPQ